MKKLISFIMATVMLISVASGCGNKTTAGDSSTQQSTAAESTTAQETKVEPKKNVELTLWGDTKTEDEYVKGMREEFLKKNPHIKINMVPRNGDYVLEFAIAFAAGDAPALMQIDMPTFPKYVKNGFFAPLDEYIANWEEKDNLIDAYKELTQKDGKTYGLLQFLSPIMFAYNKALFKEAGIAGPPKTWDEMIEYSKKLTDKSKNRYGYSLLATEYSDWWFQFYVWQAGGDLTKENEDGTISLRFTEEPIVKALQLYKDLRWNHKVVQSDITMQFQDMAKDFATGRSAMMIFAPDWIPWVGSLGMKTEDLGIAPMPVGPTGQLITSVSGGFAAINASLDKDEKDAAWEYIKYQMSREEIIKDMKAKEKKGNKVPRIMIYKDMKQADYIQLDPEWEEAVKAGALSGRAEYAGKSILTKYIVAAVQKCLVDEKADPLTELKKQQEIAQKEAVDKYNADITAKK